jgi:hypothetical protein
MTRPRALVAGIVVAGIAVASAVAAVSSGPSVTITSPKNGSAFSLKRTPKLTVAGKAAFATPSPTTTRFYLRRDGCGGKDNSGNAVANDNPHMSVTAGNPDGGDGCGSLLYTVGAGSQDTSTYTTGYPATDGVPLMLDASRTIQGVVDVQGFAGPAAGQLTVNVSADGLADGNAVTFGTDAETVTIDPTATDTAVPFTITLPSGLDGSTVGAIALDVRYSGAYAGSGYTLLSGKSYVNIPTISASSSRVVQVSVDDSSFANPVAATVSSSFDGYTVTVPTPAVGKHTVYVRATQGSATSAVASSAFTVKK